MICTAPPSTRATRRARPIRSRRALVAGAVALSLLLAACGSSDDLGGKVAKDGVGCTVSEVDRAEQAPEVPADVKVNKATKSTTDEKAGKGACEATTEQYLTVDLVGATAKDAVKAAVMLEDVARTVHLARQGGELIPIDPADIDRLYDRYQNVYGQNDDKQNDDQTQEDAR